MQEQIEKHLVVGWNEIEYGVKHKTLYERQQEAYEETEREENRE